MSSLTADVSDHGRVVARPIAPHDFPLIERLFGSRGACGGCWCMNWRVPSLGAYWEQHKGERNRAEFQRLVESGQASGCLAFHGDEVVGWCSIGPKEDFSYLERARLMPRTDLTGIWSLTCFFIPQMYQRKGISSILIRAACEHATQRGAEWLEAYPTVPKSAHSAPAAFVHTGLPAPFVRLGFIEIAQAGSRMVMRKKLM